MKKRGCGATAGRHSLLSLFFMSSCLKNVFLSAMQISYKELSMLISKYFDHYFHFKL